MIERHASQRAKRWISGSSDLSRRTLLTGNASSLPSEAATLLPERDPAPQNAFHATRFKVDRFQIDRGGSRTEHMVQIGFFEGDTHARGNARGAPR